MFGLEASELSYWLQSQYLHERFDRLSGKRPEERSRNDTIPNSVFKRLHAWLSTEPFVSLKHCGTTFWHTPRMKPVAEKQNTRGCVLPSSMKRSEPSYESRGPSRT